MKTPSDRTRLIAGATRRGGGRRPVNPPIERASTMLSDRVGDMRDESLGPTYGLTSGSAARELRAAVAGLEGADDAWIVPSGLAAVTVPLLAVARPGDEILASDAVYGPTRRFLSRWMGGRGVSVRYHPAEADAATVASLIGERTRVVLIESPASLTMEMLDVPALAAAAQAKGVLTIMDNTWAAGLAFKPLAHGVNISVQALTKYASGHSDVLIGSIATNDAVLGRAVHDTIEDMGWHVSPDDAWLTLRGIRTLPLRMTEQARSALQVTAWLRDQPEVAEVLYPPLPGSAGHDLWARDYTGAASLFGVVMTGGTTASAEAMLDSLSLFGLGYSWGGFESLATHEKHQMDYRQQPPTLAGELLRFHIGLEDPADLIADLEVGLAAWRMSLRT
ncbi:MAG TPA: cystathionine beta-lyase [Brevundimonas sp.]|jgi:cystathionine beta-lyase